MSFFPFLFDKHDATQGLVSIFKTNSVRNACYVEQSIARFVTKNHTFRRIVQKHKFATMASHPLHTLNCCGRSAAAIVATAIAVMFLLSFIHFWLHNFFRFYSHTVLSFAQLRFLRRSEMWSDVAVQGTDNRTTSAVTRNAAAADSSASNGKQHEDLQIQ